MSLQRIGDRIVLNIFSAFLAFQQGINSRTVAGMLLAFIISCLGVSVTKELYIFSTIGIFLVLSVVFPIYILFYPIMLYEILSWRRDGIRLWWMAVCALMAAWNLRNGNRFSFLGLTGELGTGILAVWLCYNRSQMELLQERYFVTQDNSKELAMELKQENRYLLEKQDSEIYMATLQERNRIAREIHDNVGHMLSRGILLTGALMAVAKEEAVRKGLYDLKDCLDEAMTNIRQSVHDLHDESIDLNQSIENLLRDLSEFQVDFEYDMPHVVPREVKYCLIAIVKEAVSNIIRHSNGDKIQVVMIEHPAFYKMLVADNGRNDSKKQGNGIGLYNIRERVEHLSGTLHISAEKTGFYIHVSIPKTTDRE